jgi:ribonuclease inhibitor
MEKIIDGTRIRTERDFHELIAASLDFPDYYGKNLDALWDVLTTMAERPATLIWKRSTESEKALGPRFETIVDLTKRVEQDDARKEPSRRFELRLE